MDSDIDRVLDETGNGVPSAALQLLTDRSLRLGVALIVAAVVSSALTTKVPWTRQASVWLYSMAAVACCAVQWATGSA
ncbi:hypothetical protein [Streptomyces sp.]|uniref:hypothetical protein n=1 Tax=Streptomyces sp. TaxID=1931 RepID=UPI0028114B7D|nr:hypothetical protein [Streptomyces sp.]